MNLTSPVGSLPGIGPAMSQKLSRLNISTIFDLLYHLPFRYEDRSDITPVARLRVGETSTVIGTLSALKNAYTRGGKIIQKGLFSDSSGSITVVWFNQSFLTRTLKPGDKFGLWGKIGFFGHLPALISPEYELNSGNRELIHMARLVPVYPETAGLSSKWLRAKIHALILSGIIEEILPPNVLSGKKLAGWKHSLTLAHFPESLGEIAPARHRLAFDELFLLQLVSLIRRKEWQKNRLAHTFTIDHTRLKEFTSRLPFRLTVSQNTAVSEILTDLSGPKPMNRLLEGDVGAGKTVVAAIAALSAHLNGYQTLFLAPTQILAQQHHQTLSGLFDPYGVKVGLVTGADKLKDETLKLKIIVGTHSLISEKILFEKVGLVVIDEQHRFGVTQRSLAAGKGSSPHILTMTATPIPRSIALTLYGDLDLTVLDELPSDRLPVKTWVVPESKRGNAYSWIKSQISGSPAVRQAFFVCPFIDISESLTSVKAARTEYEKLCHVFSGYQLGLLHGRLKSGEKNGVVAKFRAGEYNILVSTPVVEVGIDIPSATIMVIEDAERFGLAQLHQLRGRVGRSHIQSYCLLFASAPTPRLKAMETHHSGIKLAEIDLKLRGPGEMYGTAQHGLPQFKVAGYDDLGLIESAKTSASTILPDLDSYPLLRDLVKNDKITLIQPN